MSVSALISPYQFAFLAELLTGPAWLREVKRSVLLGNEINDAAFYKLGKRLISLFLKDYENRPSREIAGSTKKQFRSATNHKNKTGWILIRVIREIRGQYDSFRPSFYRLFERLGRWLAP